MFEPLDRVSVAKSVMQQIRSAMEAGELSRGDRLPPEPDLAQQLQVSRGSVREALKVLEVLGILEVRRGSGTYIADAPRLPEIDPLLFLLLLEDGNREQLVELRLMVEVGFTLVAQQKISSDGIKRLEESIALLEEAEKRKKVGPEHDLLFHRIILEETGNPFIVQLGSTVLELFRESIARGVKGYPRHAVRHHKMILEAIRSGDPRQVEDAIKQSFEVWQEVV